MALEQLKQRLSYSSEIQALLARELTELARRHEPPLRVLDVGCGTTSMLARFQHSPQRRSCRLIGLDAHGPTIGWCRTHGFHDEYLLADARDFIRIPLVDVVIATDLVEHFEKAAALDLIGQLEQKASTAVILLTPNGYIYNPFTADNPFMEHKCGFSVSELQAMGYVCHGLGGPRPLRGTQSLPRGSKPLALPALAVLSRCMRRLPAWSFHILARKQTAGALRNPSEPAHEGVASRCDPSQRDHDVPS